MRIVILGGCGFIGKNIACGFAKGGHKVIVVDKCADQTGVLEKYQIEFEKCDYLQEDNFERFFEQGDIVVHLISTSVPGTSNKDIAVDAKNNIIPSLELIKACGKKDVSKIIYASSGGQVYGIPQTVPIKETHSTIPKSGYGAHKLAIEKYLLLAETLYNVKVGILRIANPYGPGQRPFMGQGIIPTFIASAMQGKMVEIWGDGSSVRDYLYIDDLVCAFINMAKYEGSKHIFNIGSSVGYSINDIVEYVNFASGKTLDVKYIPVKEFDVKTNVLDCNKAKSELTWEAKTSLKDGIMRMVSCWDERTQSFVID